MTGDARQNARPGDKGPRYQRGDVPERPIGLSLLGLIGLVIVAGGFVGILLAVLPQQPSQPPLTDLERRDVNPPPPRLQAHPVVDDLSVRLAAERKLTEYGWADKDRTHARIPIERAMQILPIQGWPDPTPANPGTKP